MFSVLDGDQRVRPDLTVEFLDFSLGKFDNQINGNRITGNRHKPFHSLRYELMVIYNFSL